MRLRALFVALALPVLLFLSGMANAGTLLLSVDRPNNDGKVAFVIDRGSGSLFIVANMSDAFSGAYKTSESDIGDSLSVAFDQMVVLGRDALISPGSMYSGNSFSTNGVRGLGDHRSSLTAPSSNVSDENGGSGGGVHSGLSIAMVTAPVEGILSG
ncbi:hypothetical protein MNBD_BACTEROID05-241 [hydrothermal vent metagenome]|uniref:Uncharacterized protein n=1 Tax=hydrothermal vent metagenome TaxID=652676 RepID=A0A3B0TFE7_9ZZZZ